MQQSQNESREQKQVDKLGRLLDAVEKNQPTYKEKVMAEFQKMLETDSKIVRRKPIPIR